MKNYFWGEMWLADIGDDRRGSEQSGYRPVVIIQKDIGNKHSPTVIVAMISSSQKKMERNMPTHVFVGQGESGANVDSVIMLEQIRTIDKERLRRFVGMLTAETLADIDRKIKVSLGVTT